MRPHADKGENMYQKNVCLSIVGIWALAHKYLEQWFIWIAVDVVTCVLYFYKDIPFKAGLYALYVIIAIFGYKKWKRMTDNRPI